jgi:acyl carrier protein
VGYSRIDGRSARIKIANQMQNLQSGSGVARGNDHGKNDATTEIEPRIREFVARNLLFNENGFPYQDNHSFLREGIIDSLGVIELVTFVERRFALQVQPAEVTPENFDSVSRLAEFIRRKKNTPKEAHCAGS